MTLIRLGVDTGGTFTDFIWLDADGRLRLHKQLSTPHDPSAAILAGIAHHHIPETAAVVHGSTVATNALLERRGARTALITTAGFADLLAIGRQNRPDIYALVPQKPPPLIPAAWRFELNERVTADGTPLIPLDEADLPPLIDKLRAAQIESVAVCFLFSFLYPAHEEQVAAAVQAALPDVPVSLSSQILPEYREYERTATTVINAYVAPLMGRYLTRLARELAPRPLTVMQSNGGVISAETAAREAARTALSGPAGGVVGAQYVAEAAGFSNLITFDMGGTSTDVALCPGRLPTTGSGAIADMPLRLPIIDIHTVGAGGGSLAAVDAGGALHVGPQSAGADPGPACYGRAGRTPQATVTDANLVLGRLDARHFLGGEMVLDETAARAALRALAQQMGAATPQQAALGVIQVANANMERAIRRISIERGYDPRRFVLAPFGGAGPLHACELAQNLQIPQVLIPATPGVLSALGMLVAAPTKDFSQTVMIGMAGETAVSAAEQLKTALAPLQQRAIGEMAAEGVAAESLTLQTSVDMRYAGQSHELTVTYAPETDAALAQLVAQFHEAHETRYGYQRPSAPVELVTVRVMAVAPVTAPSPAATLSAPLPDADAAAAKIGEKPVWFGAEPVTASLYQRALLRPGHRFSGPAIIFQYDTTVVAPPGWETAVDAAHNLLLRRVASD